MGYADAESQPEYHAVVDYEHRFAEYEHQEESFTSMVGPVDKAVDGQIGEILW